LDWRTHNEGETVSLFRKALPQLVGDLFLTDGGIETTLMFLEGLELPHFAAFDLLKHKDGRVADHRPRQETLGFYLSELLEEQMRFSKIPFATTP
jgi:hypothetical protein